MQAIERPLVSRRLQPAPSSLNRVIDCTIACALAALTVPSIAIVALIIKMESAGPALVREERLARSGRRVLVYKRWQRSTSLF